VWGMAGPVETSGSPWASATPCPLRPDLLLALRRELVLVDFDAVLQPSNVAVTHVLAYRLRDVNVPVFVRQEVVVVVVSLLVSRWRWMP
jgi:hypothetical protein